MEKQDSKKISIILIDDNEIDNFVHLKVIELSGCSNSTKSFNSAKASLSYLDSLKEESSNPPNLILLDLNMPIMSGFDFLEEFEKLPESIKAPIQIAILSSSESKLDIRRAKENKRVIEYIPKPLSTEAFTNVVIKAGYPVNLSSATSG